MVAGTTPEPFSCKPFNSIIMSNIHIKNSSLKNKMDFLIALYGKERTDEWLDVVNHRSERSMLREWAAHKLLYKLNLERNSTISVDLEYPQSLILRICYFFVGEFSLLFFR